MAPWGRGLDCRLMLDCHLIPSQGDEGVLFLLSSVRLGWSAVSCLQLWGTRCWQAMLAIADVGGAS